MVRWIDLNGLIVLIIGVGVGIGWVLCEEVLWCGVCVVVIEWNVEVLEMLEGVCLIKYCVDVCDGVCMYEIVV